MKNKFVNRDSRIVSVKDKKAITLIALVITIIVLLILAGVSIKLVTGENGLISRAEIAKEKSEVEGYIEQIELIRADLQMQDEHYQRPNLDSLNNALKTENWVNSTEINKNENPERIELKTKEGYIIYITETSAEYKGKGEIKNITYTIKFDKNDELATGEMDNITAMKKEDTKLTANNYEKDGYSFVNWNTKSDGTGTKYENEGTVNIVEDITLYAQWEKKPTITMSFNNNKITKGTIIRVNASAESEINKIVIECNNVELYSYEYSNEFKGKTVTQNITVESLKNLDNLEFSNREYNIVATAITVNGVKNITSVDGICDYTISDVTELKQLSQLVNAGNSFAGETIYQICDIDFNGNKFDMIGMHNNSNDKPFSGVYDGGNKKIQNIYINNNNDTVAGLFAYCSSAELKNISLYGNINQNANKVVGGICGFLKDGKIENCNNYAEIKVYNRGGGICGTIWDSSIINCINNGQVIKNNSYEMNFIGGICSNIPEEHASSIISKCVNNADMTAEYNVGGIIGRNYGTIIDCSNYGEIVSKATSFDTTDNLNNACGGITATNFGTIQKSYNSGKVTGNSARVAGIAGFSNNKIENCYNTALISNNRSSGNGGGTAGITGRNDGTINYCYNYGNIVTGVTNNGKYGAISGAFPEGTINKCYYLKNTANGLDYSYDNVTSKTNIAESKAESYFKLASNNTSSVTYLLNTANNSAVWAQNSSINDGYPYLISNNPSDNK